MLSFFKLEIAPNQTLRVNINSPNFFITNFNDMKRMNLIHGVLVALFAFMGSVSLSAQTFYPSSQAAGIISTELTALASPTKGTPSNTGTIVAPNATIQSLKVTMLQMVMLELKKGAATGDAIETVFGQVSQLPGSDQGSRSTQLATVKAYVIDLLS